LFTNHKIRKDLKAMKKLTAIIWAAALVLTLSACGGDSGGVSREEISGIVSERGVTTFQFDLPITEIGADIKEASAIHPSNIRESVYETEPTESPAPPATAAESASAAGTAGSAAAPPLNTEVVGIPAAETPAARETGEAEGMAAPDGLVFTAKVLQILDNSVVVEPLAGESVLNTADRISFSTKGLDDIGAAVGDVVNVTYTGDITETYPARVTAVWWMKK
jgi:hypothetical protein